MSKRQDRQRARKTAKLEKEYGGPKGVAAALQEAKEEFERERSKRRLVPPRTTKAESK